MKMGARVIRSTAEMISNSNHCKIPSFSESLQQIKFCRIIDYCSSKTEVNLRRLLAAAPQQQNWAKLIHYVATLREQLEQLVSEATPECPQRISKAKVNDFSEKIEVLAARIGDPPPCLLGSVKTSCRIHDKDEESRRTVEVCCHSPTSPGLRRRFVTRRSYPSVLGIWVLGLSGTGTEFYLCKMHEVKDRIHEMTKSTPSSPNKLDPSVDPLVQSHIEKHRKLQEDLTDEMVGLAKQLKESSLVMNHSLQDTEKILNSTERAIEQSLADTGHTNVQAKEAYSGSIKTTCITWFAIFAIPCIFVMVVLLIR